MWPQRQLESSEDKGTAAKERPSSEASMGEVRAGWSFF